MIDVPRASRVLTESRLGNLFSHFGFRGCIVLSGSEGERRGASIGSWTSVLTSSTFNTANLLTSSDRGALFASRAKQNPPLGLNKSFLPLLHPLELSNLQSIPLFVPRLTSRRPNGRGSPSQDGWPLCTNSNLAEVRSVFSGLRLRPWVLHRMVQVEVEGALAEWRAELLERSMQGSRSLTGAWIGTLRLPTAPGRSSRLLRTRPPDQCLQVV